MSLEHIDRIVRQWGAVHPDLDTTAMGIIGRVHLLSREVSDRVERHFRAHGVGRGDYDVLASLRRSGEPARLTPAQLGEGLMLSSAGVTGRIDRLERAGLVARRPHPQDGRGVLVELTPAGRDLVDRLVHEDMERQNAWTAALSAREQATLVRLLEKVAARVEEEPAAGR